MLDLEMQNFMIQGGKPPKDAEDQGDESFWGGPFKDEFDDRLKHNGTHTSWKSQVVAGPHPALSLTVEPCLTTLLAFLGPGILSMANTGANSNRCQFFLTFSKCEHLNRKHSVFGVVIGKGLEVLKQVEKIPTDKKDRPLESIVILDTTVVDNPVKDAEELERKRIQARVDAREKKALPKDDGTRKKKAPAIIDSDGKPQIGRYLQKLTTTTTPTTTAATATGSGNLGETKKMVLPTAGKKKPKTKFGNFGGW